jgi:hypothetical protein
MQERHGLPAIRHITNGDPVFAGSQRFAHENNVRRVIIHEKDLSQRIHFALPFSLMTTTPPGLNLCTWL